MMDDLNDTSLAIETGLVEPAMEKRISLSSKDTGIMTCIHLLTITREMTQVKKTAPRAIVSLWCGTTVVSTSVIQ